jgi:hypothetical protein
MCGYGCRWNSDESGGRVLLGGYATDRYNVNYWNINIDLLSQQAYTPNTSMITPISKATRLLATPPAIGLEKRDQFIPRHNGAVIRLTGTRAQELLAVAGSYDTERISIVECYNTLTNVWTVEDCRLPIAYDYPGAAIDTTNGWVYLFGGSDREGYPHTDIQCYNPITRRWLVKHTLLNRGRRNALVTYIPQWSGFVIMGGTSATDRVLLYTK